MRWLICTLLLLMLAVPAHGNGVVAERLVPAGTAGGYLTAERPDTAGPWRISARLFTGLSHTPLQLLYGDQRRSLLDNLVSAQASVSVGLWRFLELGVALPVTLYQDGGGAPVRSALGDTRVALKGALLSRPHLGLGLLLAVALPSGNSDGFSGTGMVAFQPRLLLEVRGRHARAGLNLGATVRQGGSLAGLAVGHELTYALGLGLRPHRQLELLGEVFGSTALLAPFGDPDQRPLEAAGAVALRLGPMVLQAGGGAGVLNGYGAPTWRAFLGVAFEPLPPPPPPVVVARAPPPPPPPPPPPIEPMELAPPESVIESDTEYRGNAEIEVTDTELIPRTPIFFDVNRAYIRHEFHPVLDDLAALLKEHPELGVIQIEGHTDATGRRAHNQALSVRRGHLVREALIERGADPARLVVIGFGPTRPVAPNDDPAGRSRNRRVVFYHASHDAARSAPTP